MEKIVDKKSKTLQNSIIAIFVLCTLVFVANDQKVNIYNVMNKLKLIHRPERFTELYFENHANLPKKMAKGETISFSFTIHNVEGSDTEYPYAVYFKNSYGITKVDKNTVLVKDNEYKTITKSYTFRSGSTEEILYVELIDQKQELHFSLSKKSPLIINEIP